MKLVFSLAGLIIGSQLFVSCKREQCKYYPGIQQYFQEVFGLTLSKVEERKSYYLLPIESCESCIEENLLQLNSIESTSLVVVIVGVNYHTKWDSILVDIKTKHKILEDSLKLIYDYESGLGKPLLIKVENGNCLTTRNYSESQLAELKTELKAE